MATNTVYVRKTKRYAFAWGCLIAVLLMFSSNSYALFGSGGSECTSGEFGDCISAIQDDHEKTLRPNINDHTSTKFKEHRSWIVDTFFKEQILPALMLFSEQMTALGMQQTMTIGTFFDAKQHLEVQRTLQELQVEAHKDYQPSEEFCWFGTNVRSMAASDEKSRANAYILSRRQMARHMGQKYSAGAEDSADDKYVRWQQFKEYFCDGRDNNYSETTTDRGLSAVCNATPSPLPEYLNADIDYTRLIENARTISLLGGFGGYDYLDPQINITELSVIALQNNLYGHNVLKRSTATEKNAKQYLELRSITAKRGVAEASFNEIVGLKSAGTSSAADSTTAESAKFLGAILKELGITDNLEIYELLGSSPSYYAQLELLAKKIYQSPNFYAGLYDTPANVKRKSVALKAIELMVDREIYESQTRQEMLTSVLLSTRMSNAVKDTAEGLGAK